MRIGYGRFLGAVLALGAVSAFGGTSADDHMRVGLPGVEKSGDGLGLSSGRRGSGRGGS